MYWLVSYKFRLLNVQLGYYSISRTTNTNYILTNGSTVHLVVNQELNITFGLALNYFQTIILMIVMIIYNIKINIILLLTNNIIEKRTWSQVNNLLWSKLYKNFTHLPYFINMKYATIIKTKSLDFFVLK